MNKENIVRKKVDRDTTKSVPINIRVTPQISQWMKEHNYSPTGIFYEALKDLKCPHVQ